MSSSPLIKQNLETGTPMVIGNISIRPATLQHSTIKHVIIKPGGSWSKDLKAKDGTDSCQKTHAGFIISGMMAVRMNDGKEEHYSKGDAFGVSPGHDAWCVGDEDTVFVEWSPA